MITIWWSSAYQSDRLSNLFGNGANVRFQDLTQFNCVPPQEQDVPNLFLPVGSMDFGTDINYDRYSVTINGTPASFPFSGPIITRPDLWQVQEYFSDMINVAND